MKWGSQGHSISDVLSGTNISPDAMNQSSLYISQVQKIQLFQNIQKLSHDPLIGLRAGQKQRLSDFGVYGYALYSSRNFRQAVELGIRHIKLAGPILKKSFYIRDDVAVFEGQDIIALGKLLFLIYKNRILNSNYYKKFIAINLLVLVVNMKNKDLDI